MTWKTMNRYSTMDGAAPQRSTGAGVALDGHVRKGLFFRAAGTLPFGTQIRPVVNLLQWLLDPRTAPAAQQAPA